MVEKKKFKLSDGSEIEVRPLTFIEKLPIKDIYYDLTLRTGKQVVPIMTCCATALMQIGFRAEQLKTWTDDDIFLAGNWILEKSELVEREKKN